MEGALVTLAMKAAFDPENKRTEWPRLDEVPFDAEHRFMATLHQMSLADHVVLVKGAPEVVLAMCNRQELWKGRRHSTRASGRNVLPKQQHRASEFWGLACAICPKAPNALTSPTSNPD